MDNASDERVARIDPEHEEICLTVGTSYDSSVSPKRHGALSVGATPVSFGPVAEQWLRLPLPLRLVVADPPGAELSLLRNRGQLQESVAVVYRGSTSFVEAVRNCQR